MTWKITTDGITVSFHDTEDDAIAEVRRTIKDHDEKIEKLEEEIQELREFSDSLGVEEDK
jgi:prefoldin subunit 5|tara:strand:- start:2494 stop:2673 length:180 start_codon:yes stop_codon:yes gene_type:complete